MMLRLDSDREEFRKRSRREEGVRGEGPVNTRAVRNAGENSGRGRRSEEEHGLEKDRRWRTQGVEGSRIVRVVIGRDSQPQ